MASFLVIQKRNMFQIQVISTEIIFPCCIYIFLQTMKLEVKSYPCADPEEGGGGGGAGGPDKKQTCQGWTPSDQTF